MSSETGTHGRWKWLAVAAAVVHLGLSIHAAAIETPTVDEFGHLPAGCAYLRHGSFDLFAKNPPLMKMAMALPVVLRTDSVVPSPQAQDLASGWGPWRYGDRFMHANGSTYFELFFLARLVVVWMGIGCGLILFLWARSLWGERAASLTTAMFLLTPLIVAHGHLATVDTGSMFSIFLTAFLLRYAYQHPGHVRFVVAGAAWGLALLVKYTAVILVPAILLIALIEDRKKPRQLAGRVGIVIATAMLVVNLGLGFDGSFRALSEYHFVSSFGTSLQENLPDWLPVPLPQPYVEGFDAVKRDTESGEFGSYLLGEWSRQGWWYYDLFALSVKNPIPFSIMVLLCPWFLSRGRQPKSELVFILAPLLTLSFLMLSFNSVQIGVRYALPLMPFLFLCFASIWKQADGRVGRALRIIVPGWFALALLSQHPGHLSYFNLAAGGERHGHELLIDSNLDWGQDLYRVPTALQNLQHDGPIGLLYFGHVDPALYGIEYHLVPPRPVEGVIAVSVNYLMGYPYPATRPDGSRVSIRPDHLAWLTDIEPIERLGSIWIYDTRR